MVIYLINTIIIIVVVNIHNITAAKELLYLNLRLLFHIFRQVITASLIWMVVKTTLVLRARTVLTSRRKNKCPLASHSTAASVRKELKRMKEHVCVSPTEEFLLKCIIILGCNTYKRCLFYTS